MGVTIDNRGLAQGMDCFVETDVSVCGGSSDTSSEAEVELAIDD